VSWVVAVGIVHIFLTTEGGVVNEMIFRTGFEKISFLSSTEWFRTLITSEVIWKETGWGTIIFLAALAGIDPTLHEAARIDGASRWGQMLHITIPVLKSVIVILLILRFGYFLDSGFEQIYLMVNAVNREVGEVFDTYVYTSGIQGGQFSYSTAFGLLNEGLR
jgi:putative aldouronate transport system permease protein